jgi:hypothetical protein
MRSLVIAALLLALTNCSEHSEPTGPKYEIAVISALPLFWSDPDPTTALTQGDERAPIIRKLAETFVMTPVDLADERTLQKYRLLILAQPAALGGAELVALDAWVRAGGRLLIFADPMLMWVSPYALGDARAAPRVTMLDPLLTHWGVQLLPPVIRTNPTPEVAELSGAAVTVLAAGQWQTNTKGCKLTDAALRVICQFGTGRVELVADADLLDLAALGADGIGNGPAIASLLRKLSDGLPASVSEPLKEQDKNKLNVIPQSGRLSRQQE